MRTAEGLHNNSADVINEHGRALDLMAWPQILQQICWCVLPPSHLCLPMPEHDTMCMPELTVIVTGHHATVQAKQAPESCTSKHAEMSLAGAGRGPGSLVMSPGVGSGTALPVARTRTSSTCLREASPRHHPPMPCTMFVHSKRKPLPHFFPQGPALWAQDGLPSLMPSVDFHHQTIHATH